MRIAGRKVCSRRRRARRQRTSARVERVAFVGKCYRLCTEVGFRTLPEQGPPEMVRSDLAATVLQLKALGIDNVMHFEWLSPPRFGEDMLKALELLYALQALGNDARLTRPLGMYLAELPLEPQLGKALLSGELGCVEEMLTVASYLQVQERVGIVARKTAPAGRDQGTLRGGGGRRRHCAQRSRGVV